MRCCQMSGQDSQRQATPIISEVLYTCSLHPFSHPIRVITTSHFRSSHPRWFVVTPTLSSYTRHESSSYLEPAGLASLTMSRYGVLIGRTSLTEATFDELESCERWPPYPPRCTTHVIPPLISYSDSRATMGGFDCQK
jgi:hypothetical protein